MRTADLATLPLTVRGPDARVQQVPLGQLAVIRTGLGPARIDHLDRERVITVQANTENRPLNEVIKDIDEQLVGLTLPPGVTIRKGGETEDQQEVFGRILAALAVAILLMYLVLVIQFGSFLDPLAIMISRRSTRSSSTPATGPASTAGTARASITPLTIRPDPVVCMTRLNTAMLLK